MIKGIKGKRKTRETIKNKNKLSSSSKKRKPLKIGNSNMKVVGATKVTYMGIEFKSKLEFYMYKLLEEQGNLDFKYEEKSFKILESISLDYDCFENCKGKGYIKISNTIRSASYKPDFIVETDNKIYIIETKGFKTDIFQLRNKVFKHMLQSTLLEFGKKVELHMPTSQRDCNIVLQKILKDVSESI